MARSARVQVKPPDQLASSLPHSVSNFHRLASWYVMGTHANTKLNGKARTALKKVVKALARFDKAYRDEITWQLLLGLQRCLAVIYEQVTRWYTHDHPLPVGRSAQQRVEKWTGKRSAEKRLRDERRLIEALFDRFGVEVGPEDIDSLVLTADRISAPVGSAEGLVLSATDVDPEKPEPLEKRCGPRGDQWGPSRTAAWILGGLILRMGGRQILRSSQCIPTNDPRYYPLVFGMSPAMTPSTGLTAVVDRYLMMGELPARVAVRSPAFSEKNAEKQGLEALARWTKARELAATLHETPKGQTEVPAPPSEPADAEPEPKRRGRKRKSRFVTVEGQGQIEENRWAEDVVAQIAKEKKVELYGARLYIRPKKMQPWKPPKRRRKVRRPAREKKVWI